MKKIKQPLNLLVIAIMTSILTISCGGGSKSEIAKVKPEKVEITGDLSDYLQVVDGEYEVTDNFGGHLSIKVKATKALPEGEMINKTSEIRASLLNESGMPVSGTGDLVCYVNNDDKLLNLLKKGTGEEVISLSSLLTEYNAKEHAGKVKKFSVSSTIKEKEAGTVSASESSDNSYVSSDESVSASSSTDCDQFITDYEEFIRSYIAILKKYKANPTDASILTEYTEMASKAASMQTDASNCTDAKYAAKLTKLNTKIANAAAGM